MRETLSPKGSHLQTPPSPSPPHPQLKGEETQPSSLNVFIYSFSSLPPINLPDQRTTRNWLKSSSGPGTQCLCHLLAV